MSGLDLVAIGEGMVEFSADGGSAAADLFRRGFAGDVVNTLIHASRLGLRTGLVSRIGDDLFAPEWTDYFKRIHYRTYDVTALLQAGDNILDATLGDGWWSGFVGWQEQRGRYGSLENSLLLQLEIELADGTKVTIGSRNFSAMRITRRALR